MNPYYTSILVRRFLRDRKDLHLVGVTGCMGSGKTAFCNDFVNYCLNQGVMVAHLDIDQLVKTLYTSSDELSKRVLADIGASFPETIFNQGKLNTRKLADIIFNSKLMRERLAEILTIPLVMRYEQAITTKRGLTLVESAYFTEYNLMSLVDFNFIFVSCDEQERFQRIKKRNGWAEQEIQARINSQNTEEEKRRLIKEAQTRMEYRFFEEVNTTKPVDYSNVLNKLNDYFKVK
jgi:dephospho-CoA kinase